jgi:hypothetical protein
MAGPADLLNQRPALRLTLTIISIAGLAGVLGLLIAKKGLPVAAGFIAAPPALTFITICIRRPVVGLITSLYVGFFLGGLGRWGPASVPFGLSIDILLTISLVGLLFYAEKGSSSRLNSPLVYLLLLWLAYIIFQLANPEARNREAWFYTARGFSFYWLQVTLIALLTTHRLRDLTRFVRIWISCSVVLALWGFKQQYIGLSGGDKEWMDNFGYITHMLMGHLRSFSFCSDAGQFGAAMAHITVFVLIQGIEERNTRRKIGYFILMGIFFWGYAVAGSRGPLLIIMLGIITYVAIRRNVVIFILIGTLGVIGFGVLKFTFIGQGNYQVQRMRSALDPNDASLAVRVGNQRAFADYMRSRPFGIGLGMAGDAGKRFGGSSVVTERGVDSWYVKVWVETGIVGLVIHVTTLLIILGIGYRNVIRLHTPKLKTIMSGLLSGYVGILGASYGNMIIGQFPSSLIIYFTMVCLVICPLLDTAERERT